MYMRKRKSKRERDGERPFKQKGESRNKTTHMWLIDFQQRDKINLMENRQSSQEMGLGKLDNDMKISNSVPYDIHTKITKIYC